MSKNIFQGRCTNSTLNLLALICLSILWFLWSLDNGHHSFYFPNVFEKTCCFTINKSKLHTCKGEWMVKRSSSLLTTPSVSSSNPAQGIFVGFVRCLYKIIVCMGWQKKFWCSFKIKAPPKKFSVFVTKIGYSKVNGQWTCYFFLAMLVQFSYPWTNNLFQQTAS